MTAYEIGEFETAQRGAKEDRRIAGEGWVLRNDQFLGTYLKAVKAEPTKAFANLSDEEILQLQNVEKAGLPTLAGLLVFSKYPQAVFPGLGITAVVVPGNEYGTALEDGTRFLDNIRIEGSAADLLEGAMAFVKKHTYAHTSGDEQGGRKCRWEYPLRAVREAILNALVHRDYSRPACGTPVRLILFDDRMEIINCGGVCGGVPVNRLGNDIPNSRNADLARILELLKISENRYSGIPLMKREMEANGQPEPEFEDNGRQFKVTLRKAARA